MYFTKDPITGVVTQKRDDLQKAQIPPPTQELFKNEMYDLFLADAGLFDKLNAAHLRGVKDARARGETHEWEDTIAQFNAFLNR